MSSVLIWCLYGFIWESWHCAQETNLIPTLHFSSLKSVWNNKKERLKQACTVSLIDIFKIFPSRTKEGTVVEGERFHVLENGQFLKIIRSEKGDTGKYACMASNREGMSNLTALLDVKGMSAKSLHSSFVNEPKKANQGMPFSKGISYFELFDAHILDSYSMCAKLFSKVLKDYVNWKCRVRQIICIYWSYWKTCMFII